MLPETCTGVGSLVDSPSQEQARPLVKVNLSIANIDFKMTTKEVKEIKFFADKFLKYHKDLEDQVQEELIKLRLEAQFRQSFNRNQSQKAESLSLQA